MNKKQLIASWLIVMFFLPEVCLAKSSFLGAPGTVIHIGGDSESGYEQVDSSVMDKRLEESAEEHGDKGAVVRTAHYDLTGPADNQEYIALNKNLVLMITAVTHNKEELPIKRVYLKSSDGEIVLEKFLSKSMSVTDDKVKDVLGAYREDSFYLLPIYLTDGSRDLLIDWQKGRDGFIMESNLFREWECSIDNDEHPDVQNFKLNEKALKKFLKREYSIIFEKK